MDVQSDGTAFPAIPGIGLNLVEKLNEVKITNENQQLGKGLQQPKKQQNVQQSDEKNTVVPTTTTNVNATNGKSTTTLKTYSNIQQEKNNVMF